MGNGEHNAYCMSTVQKQPGSGGGDVKLLELKYGGYNPNDDLS